MKSYAKQFCILLTVLLLTLAAGCAAGAANVPPAAPDSVQQTAAPATAPEETAAPTQAPEKTTAPATVSEKTSAPVQTPSIAQPAFITEEAAKKVALAHAGVSEADASFVRVKLDTDDSRPEYEVEFYSAQKEYDYEIDATTGEILSCDYDAEHYDLPKTTESEKSGTETLISEADAKAVALSHAGLRESEVTGLHVERERDDGRTIYDVEFHVGKTEYSYEIDAESGRILESDMDND